VVCVRSILLSTTSNLNFSLDQNQMGQHLLSSTHAILLEDLPRVILVHIMSYLSHSTLLNLSLSNTKLHDLVMREWNFNPQLWRHITIPPIFTLTQLQSLTRNLKRNSKLKFIRSVKISDSKAFMSNVTCRLLLGLCHLPVLHSIVIQSHIENQHLIKILKVFNNQCARCIHHGLHHVEITKANFVAQKI
jgi:hypothetical protein